MTKDPYTDPKSPYFGMAELCFTYKGITFEYHVKGVSRRWYPITECGIDEWSRRIGFRSRASAKRFVNRFQGA